MINIHIIAEWFLLSTLFQYIIMNIRPVIYYTNINRGGSVLVAFLSQGLAASIISFFV